MSREGLYAEAPFSYSAAKDGMVRISYNGKAVTILRGAKSSRFLARIDTMDTDAAQLEMAKITGHFKHGNERTSKHRRGSRQ
jgi:hypothetical protein